jgi:hypothetical protein
VKGDRGEDLGIVIAVLTENEFEHKRRFDLRVAANIATVGCILRLASRQERVQLSDKNMIERNVVLVSPFFSS